jgi:hypothetical protein
MLDDTLRLRAFLQVVGGHVMRLELLGFRRSDGDRFGLARLSPPAVCSLL